MTRVIRHKINLSTHRGTINLVALGDIHRANNDCEIDLLKKVYKWIRKHNCHVIGMGDYSEWITAKDRRYNTQDYFVELIHPRDQFRQVQKEFTPFKDKIIALLDGNHDFLIYQQHYHNYVDALAFNLGTEYGTFDAIIRLEISRENNLDNGRIVDIYAHHGWTGARTTGGKTNRLEDLGKIFPGLDLYLMGHVHTLGAIPPKPSLYVNRSDVIVEKMEYYAFTGSFLRGYNNQRINPHSNYVARKGYVPTSLGALLVKIQPFRGSQKGNQDRLHIEIGTVPV